MRPQRPELRVTRDHLEPKLQRLPFATGVNREVDRQPAAESHREAGSNAEGAGYRHERLADQHQSDHHRRRQRERQASCHRDERRQSLPQRPLMPAVHVHPVAKRVGDRGRDRRVEDDDARDVGRVFRMIGQRVAAEDVRRKPAPARGLANPVRTARGGRRHFSKPRVCATRSGLAKNGSIWAKNQSGASNMMKWRADSAMAKCSVVSFAN